jgi:hypothetical protein
MGHKQSAPPQAQPVDYAALMRASAEAGAQMVESQFNSQIKHYPDQERQQLGTIQNIAGLLGESGGPLMGWYQTGKGKNQKWEQRKIGAASPDGYTTAARQAIESAMSGADGIDRSSDEVMSLGSWLGGTALRNYDSSGPTSIEAELYRQAESDLGLGRSLSAAELRDAQQSARASMGARGLGSSMAATAAEILNRDSYAQARESARRNFAGSANDMMLKNVMARRDQAGQQLALGANMLGNSGQLRGAAGNMRIAGASGLLAVDPMRTGLTTGANMATMTQGNMGQLIGNTYGNALNMAGNVASYNGSMLDSRFNSFMNNQASLQAARMRAGANKNSGMMGMMGGIGGGALMGVGLAL